MTSTSPSSDQAQGTTCPKCGTRSTAFWCECGADLRPAQPTLSLQAPTPLGEEAAQAPPPSQVASPKSRRRGQKPPGQENWTWREIDEGRRISKAEKRVHRTMEHLGATPNQGGGYNHSPESAIFAVVLLLLTLGVAVFFPRGCM